MKRTPSFLWFIYPESTWARYLYWSMTALKAWHYARRDGGVGLGIILDLVLFLIPLSIYLLVSRALLFRFGFIEPRAKKEPSASSIPKS